MTESHPGDPVANEPANQQKGERPLAGQPPGGEATPAQPTDGQPLADAPAGEQAYPTAQAEAVPHASSIGDDQVPDWLKELSESSVGEALEVSAPKPSVEPIAYEETPASDADLGIVEPTAPAYDELPDWMKEAAQPQERPTLTAAPEMQASSQTETSEDELPQWLSHPYETPAGEQPTVLPEAKEKGVVVPAAATGELPVTAASHVDEGTSPSNTKETAQAPEVADLQVPDLLTSEPQAEQSQEAPTVERKGTGPGKEGTIETADLTPAADQELAPETFETGKSSEWTREIVSPASHTLPGTANTLRSEPPQLAADERGQLPDWLREAVPGHGGAEPTPVGSGSEPLTPTPPSEMPAWVEELKAHAGLAATGEPLPEPAGTVGPLAGVHGVLPIAFSIAQPHTISALGPSQSDGGRVFESVLTAATQGALAPTAATAKPARKSRANRWIYLAVLLAALIPLFIPSDSAGLGLKVNNTTPTAQFYDKIHSLAPGSTVLLAFDYDAGQTVELNPAARVIVLDLAQRHVNVVALSTSPAGAQIAQTILLEAAQQNPNWRRGDNFVNVGYIPGEEAGLRALADRWLPQNQVDFENEPLASLPLADKAGGLRDFALAIEFAGGDASLRWWMEQVQPRQQVAFVAAVSAAVEPQARNYLAANQLAAFLRGLGGAAEYELFSNQTGLTVRTADALSFSQILIAAMIVIGNVVFLFGRLRKSAPTSTLTI